jgi:hypothetical protein
VPRPRSCKSGLPRSQRRLAFPSSLLLEVLSQRAAPYPGGLNLNCALDALWHSRRFRLCMSSSISRRYQVFDCTPGEASGWSGCSVASRLPLNRASASLAGNRKAGPPSEATVPLLRGLSSVGRNPSLRTYAALDIGTGGRLAPQREHTSSTCRPDS